MKLRKTNEKRIVYFDAAGNEHPREEILVQVQGKSISEGKQIVSQYNRVEAVGWADREGNIVAWSYSPIVSSIEIQPANADAQRADYLRRLREAQARCARPDATQHDMAEALRLMIEYQEFLDLLAD